MADIVLAQIGGQTWLVAGEAFIDDLLANTLPDDVTIEIVSCESESEVDVILRANRADPACTDPPWMIHPSIVERCRSVPFDGIHRISFGPWSALRMAAADATLAAAAAEAAGAGDARVVLTSHVALGGPALADDLANLRSGVVEAEMVAAGIAGARIGRARTGVTEDDPEMADRIDITVVALDRV